MTSVNPCYYFMEQKFLLIPQFSECLQVKKGSVTEPYRCVAKLNSFGFYYVVVGQQYSYNFVLVSHFYFEMFGIMADIFLLAVFFYVVFTIFCLAHLAVFKFAFFK